MLIASEVDWQRVYRFIEENGIGRFMGDRLVFMDDGEPIKQLVPPARFRGDSRLFSGINHIQWTKPPVALVLSMHRHGKDFERILTHAGHLLESAPVVGVEADPAEELGLNKLAAPLPQVRNIWLRDFQQAQFAWHNEKPDSLTLRPPMVPCEPQFSGSMKVWYDQLSEWLEYFLGPHSEHGAAESMVIGRILQSYRHIYRCWGLLGQFGWWLQHPLVKAKDNGSRFGLVLGAAHQYEHDILTHYCKTDVVTVCLEGSLWLDAPDAPGVTHEMITKAVEWDTCLRREVPRGFMELNDLLVPLPV